MIKHFSQDARTTGHWPQDFASTFKLQNLNFFVYHNHAVVAAHWRDVEAEHRTTFFQTYDWCASWLDTIGKTQAALAYVVVVLNQLDEFVALLPFQIRRHRSAKRLEWLASDQITYGFGIFSHWALSEAGRSSLQEALPAIVEHSKVDSVHLKFVPGDMHGVQHPFANHCNCRDADQSSYLLLHNDFDALLAAKRSGDSRKNIRWRDSKITAAGKLSISETREDFALAELFRDQANRLQEVGIADPTRNGVNEFFKRLLQNDGGGLSILRVAINDKGIASLLLAKQGDTIIDLMTSLADTELRKYSPGDLALRKSIELACQQGFKYFDFSVGSAPYKTQWADDQVELYHIIRARTFRGYIDASLMLTKQTAKRIIKGNALLKNLAYKARLLLHKNRRV